MEWHRLDGGVTMTVSSSNGFSLVETVVALGVLVTGVLGAAAVLSSGMQNLSSSPADVVSTQKAAEAMEAVFSARQSGKLTWSQIKNKNGASGSDNGIFLDGLQPLNLSGADGLVNTDDDTVPVSTTGPTPVCPEVCWGVETVRLPGRDQLLNTADDSVTPLSSFQREIKIRDVGLNGQLRSIVVTVTYKNGPTTRTYTLTTYLSSYS
jgi:type II secretory pathway pseudopilin PulG